MNLLTPEYGTIVRFNFVETIEDNIDKIDTFAAIVLKPDKEKVLFKLLHEIYKLCCVNSDNREFIICRSMISILLLDSIYCDIDDLHKILPDETIAFFRNRYNLGDKIKQNTSEEILKQFNGELFLKESEIERCTYWTEYLQKDKKKDESSFRTGDDVFYLNEVDINFRKAHINLITKNFDIYRITFKLVNPTNKQLSGLKY